MPKPITSPCRDGHAKPTSALGNPAPFSYDVREFHCDEKEHRCTAMIERIEQVRKRERQSRQFAPEYTTAVTHSADETAANRKGHNLGPGNSSMAIEEEIFHSGKEWRVTVM